MCVREVPCGGLLGQQTSQDHQHVENEGLGQDVSQSVHQQVVRAEPAAVWTAEEGERRRQRD